MIQKNRPEPLLTWSTIPNGATSSCVLSKILPKHLTLVGNGGYGYSYKRCNNCGYETAEDFEFCPKCGNRF